MPYPTKKLGEVLEKNGVIPAKIKRDDYRQNGKYPVVDQGENLIAGYIDDEQKLYRGDLPVVVFGDHTRILKYVDFPFAFGADGTKILRPQEILLPKFFYYVLVFNPIENQGYKRHFSLLTQVKIPLPPLEVQKQIVERLDKIAEAQKLNGGLIQKTDELFQSLLHKELNPAAPADAKAKAGKKNWEIKKLGEVCEKTDQGQPKNFFKKEFRYIDISSINAEAKEIQNANLIPVEGAPSRARKIVNAGDIVFATTRPYLENIAIVPTGFNNAIASTGFCVIRAKTKIVNPDFIYFTVISKPFIKKVLPFQRGANYPAVSDKDIFGIKIPLPPLKTQKQIIAKLSAVQGYKKQLLGQKAKLKELFDSALHKSMTNK